MTQCRTDTQSLGFVYPTYTRVQAAQWFRFLLRHAPACLVSGDCIRRPPKGSK